jgi:hypothetical protein
VVAHADRPFDGQLSLTGWGVKPTRLKLWINGEALGQIDLAASSGLSLTTSAAVPVHVPQGLVVLRIELESGEGYVGDIRVTR